MVEFCESEGLKYIISYPDNFKSDKKYPLIIFLHGAGTRGDDLRVLQNNINFVNLCKWQVKEYILAAPLCPVNNWNEHMNKLIGFTDMLRSCSYVDNKRVHLTGNSMGGYGTWELTGLRPDWFASAMPVCGGGIPWMSHNLTNVPIKAFHGILDTVVEPYESLAMVRAVNLRGGHAHLILFPDLAHDCWTRVYSTEANIDWLLGFSTDRKNAQSENFSGDYYG